MKVLFLFIIFSSSSVFSKLELVYKWINLKKKFSAGRCYQVDAETSGEKFINKVKPTLCKPQNTYEIFDYKSGNCFEVDEESNGKQYFQKTDIKNCETSKTTYLKGTITNKYGCFKIDGPSNGQAFYQKVDNDFCQESTVEVFWKPTGQFKGTCITKGLDDKPKKIPLAECRPLQTKFEFLRTGPTSGKCYEIDNRGEQYFSTTAQLKKCKVSKTEFIFLKGNNPTAGTCYEIDIQTKGNEYLAKVKNEKCI